MKHNGKYYLLMISMDWSIPGRVRREVCYRADKITGPYEKKVILEHDFDGYGGVGQGCIIDSEEGDWYGVIFQDRGGIGRVPTLMPCRWVDGWPMLGDENGHVPLTMEKRYIRLKILKEYLEVMISTERNFHFIGNGITTRWMISGRSQNGRDIYV